MTLIIAVKADDCFVLAADSLTTKGDVVISCDTQKLSQISATAIAAAAGYSGPNGCTWNQLLPAFFSQGEGPAPALAAPKLKTFLDKQIASANPKIHGLCRGGNTFLTAGANPASGALEIWSIRRVGDRRQFEPAVPEAPSSPQAHIWWIGDTQNLQRHMTETSAAFRQDMSEQRAVDFAVRAITDGITIARNAGIGTIGGHFVYFAVANRHGVSISKRESGTACP